MKLTKKNTKTTIKKTTKNTKKNSTKKSSYVPLKVYNERMLEKFNAKTKEAKELRKKGITKVLSKEKQFCLDLLLTEKFSLKEIQSKAFKKFNTSINVGRIRREHNRLQYGFIRKPIALVK